MSLKSQSVAFLLFLLPTRFVRPFVTLLGVRIHPTAKVGFSWVECQTLMLHPHTRIGHLNVIRVRRLLMRKKSAIGSMNWLRGPFSASLGERAEIGSRNVISRALFASEVGTSQLRIGADSKITASHKLDLLRSITIGTHSILAGSSSQLWTHGYVHEPNQSRFRVDGAIRVGHNVYLGSACVINAGVTVGSNISIGSQSCVSKDLIEPGLYVNQPLRHIERSTDAIKASLSAVELPNLTEPTYVKQNTSRIKPLRPADSGLTHSGE